MGGFGILALVIGYLPALYSALARREVAVSMLDERASSPPSAGELLRRYAEDDAWDALDAYLRDWETWAAELMESHLSYPMLAYFRSQHDNQSWLAALTTILDACALIMAGLPDLPRHQHQARLTYAMARHAAVDLAQTLVAEPRPPEPARLTPDGLARLRDELAAQGARLSDDAGLMDRLCELHDAYEPYVNALGERLALPLPPWASPPDVRENWRATAWRRPSRALF